MFVGRLSQGPTDVSSGGSNSRPRKPKTCGKKTPISTPTTEEKISDDSNSSPFTNLDNIAEDAIVCILSFLSPDEITACRCLNRRLRDLCSDDARVWLAICERRWGTSTEIRRWGNGKIKYRLLYDILERWHNLIGFWRGVGHGGNGPLVVFDWGAYSVVASRIMPARVGGYEVRKVPFLWTGLSGEGKGLSFVNPDWFPESGLGKGKIMQSGSGLFADIDDGGGFGSFSGLGGGLDGGSGFSEGRKEENMRNGVRVDKVTNPFENMDLEDCVPAGLMSVNLSFVGNSHIVVEENQDRHWVKNHQAPELLLRGSNSYSDLSKKISAGLDNGAYSPPGSLPDGLQSEIYEYFANKVSPSGVRAARKQRRKEKERAAGYGRRRWEAEHFVKVAHWSPTPARPLQGLWKERDKLVAEMMRYVLFKNHQHPGVPVKREELTQLVTKNYHQRNLPAVVITQAQKKFASIFGYEMKELQRSRPSKTNNVRSSQQSTTESKSYILRSMLPEEFRTKLVENKETSHLIGLTFAIVGILQLAGGKVPEDTLWQYLRRLGLDEHDEKHPHFGNVKQAIETVIKQRYIQKEKVNGPEGDMIVYELAERALDEFVNGRLKESITQTDLNSRKHKKEISSAAVGKD